MGSRCGACCASCVLLAVEARLLASGRSGELHLAGYPCQSRLRHGNCRTHIAASCMPSCRGCVIACCTHLPLPMPRGSRGCFQLRFSGRQGSCQLLQDDLPTCGSVTLGCVGCMFLFTGAPLLVQCHHCSDHGRRTRSGHSCFVAGSRGVLQPAPVIVPVLICESHSRHTASIMSHIEPVGDDALGWSLGPGPAGCDLLGEGVSRWSVHETGSPQRPVKLFI